MNLLKRTSYITIFLTFIMILKSVLSIFMRSLIAAKFGAGTETDAYYAAFTIPQQLSDFFIGGILFAAIIPLFQKRVAEAGIEKATYEMSALINISAIILIIGSALYLLLCPFIIKLVFSGFTPEKQLLTILYSRFFSPLIFLFGLSLIYCSLYNSFRDFFMPSISALIYPLSSILALYAFPASMGIKSVVYGNLIGALLGIFLLIAFIRKKIKWKWTLDYKNPLISKTFFLSIPVVLENLFLKLAIFIKNKIISILPLNGALTMIELSLFVVHSVVIFISGPISTAIFPLLGYQEANTSRGELVSTFQKTLNIILFIAFPFNVFILFEAEHLIRLLFGYGRFTDFECITTAKLVIITSFVILPNCIQSLTGRMFFILQYTKIPSIISSTLMMIGAGICYLVAIKFGIYGFMIAATIGTCVGALANLIILLIRLKWKLSLQLLNSPLKSFVAAILMGLVLISTNRLFKNYDFPLLIYILLNSTIAFASYLLLSWLMKHEELKYLVSIPLKRFTNE